MSHLHPNTHTQTNQPNNNSSINPTTWDQGWSKLDQCPPENVNIANQAVTTAVDVSGDCVYMYLNTWWGCLLFVAGRGCTERMESRTVG